MICFSPTLKTHQKDQKMNSISRKRNHYDSRMNTCMEAAINQLYAEHENLMQTNSLLGTGMLVVIASAEDLVHSRRESLQISKQNALEAHRRNEVDAREAAGTLEQAILKDPIRTLAQSRSTIQGCRDLIALWTGLGSVLLKKDGWNEMEIKLACSLIGVNHKVRCSKDWTRLDRCMTADKARPYQVLELNLQEQLRQYASDFSKRMIELYPEMESPYSVGLCMMEEWRLGLEYRLQENKYYDLKAYEFWRINEVTSRKYWSQTRSFVASQIRGLRRQAAAVANLSEKVACPPAALKFTAQEMKAAEWSRKMIVSTTSNFQKSMAMAKSIGLLNDSAPPKRKSKTDSRIGFELDPQTCAFDQQNQGETVVELSVVRDEKPVKARSIRKSRKPVDQDVSSSDLRATGVLRNFLDDPEQDARSNRRKNKLLQIAPYTAENAFPVAPPLLENASKKVSEQVDPQAPEDLNSCNRLAEVNQKGQNVENDENSLKGPSHVDPSHSGQNSGPEIQGQ